MASYGHLRNINNLKDINMDTFEVNYSIIEDKIKTYLPDGVQLLSQGKIVANSLKDYLIRHPEIEIGCSKNKTLTFYTTDLPKTFDAAACLFYGESISSNYLPL